MSFFKGMVDRFYPGDVYITEQPLESRFAEVTTTEALDNILRLIKEETKLSKGLTGTIRQNADSLQALILNLGKTLTADASKRPQLQMKENEKSLETIFQELSPNDNIQQSIERIETGSILLGELDSKY